MSVRGNVWVLLLAACTSTRPAEPAEEAEAEPLPERVDGPKIAGVHAIDGARALITGTDEAGAPWLALVGGAGPPVWKVPLTSKVSARDLVFGFVPQVAGQVVSLPRIEDDEYRGIVGLDLATGSELWQTAVPADELRRLRLTRSDFVQSIGDATERIDVVSDQSTIALVSFDPVHGSRMSTTAYETGGAWHRRRYAVTPAHLAFASGSADADDPDNHDSVWYVVRRADATRVFRGTGGDAGCVVDERFYVQRGEAIAVVDLREERPAARTLLPAVAMPGVAGAGRLLSCHAYAGLPVLVTEHEHRATQVSGLDADGGVAWQFSLGERRIHQSQFMNLGNDPLPAELPAFFAVIAEGRLGGSSLLVVDMTGRRVARELSHAYEQWTDPHVFHVDGRSFIALTPGDPTAERLGVDRRTTSMFAAIDGATGTLGEAMMVSGGQWVSRQNVAGGQLWLAPRLPGEALAAVPRSRVDAATMQPVGQAPAGLEVKPGTRELPVAFSNLGDGPPWPPRPGTVELRVSDRAAEASDPDRRTGPVTPPTWERGPIDEAARRSCKAPDATPVALMGWQIKEDARELHLEYAFAGLDYEDPRGHAWCLTLLIRTQTTGPWEVYQGGSHAPDRRRILRRRPSNADAYKLLEGEHGWSFRTQHGFWIAAGDVLDDAWLAVTGEAPTKFLQR